MNFQMEEDDECGQVEDAILITGCADLNGQSVSNQSVSKEMSRTEYEKAIYQERGMWKSYHPTRFG